MATTTLPPEPPSHLQELQPIEDYATVLLDDEQGGTTAIDKAAPEIEIEMEALAAADGSGTTKNAVLRFPAELGQSDCIVDAELALQMTGGPAVVLAVYPGDPAILDDTQEGESINSTHMLLADHPRGIIEIDDGIGRADVTDLVKTWADGSFTSIWPNPTPATPIALVIRRTTYYGSETFHLQMSESGPTTSPVLRIKRTC